MHKRVWISGGKVAAAGDNGGGTVDGQKILKRWPETSCAEPGRGRKNVFTTEEQNRPGGNSRAGGRSQVLAIT
jgi:hypothetical protein